MYSGYRFASATNPAYFYSTPWWLRFFSGSLFLRKNIHLKGFISPGSYPYVPLN